MQSSRKQFLRQASLLLSGSLLPFSKFFANGAIPQQRTGDTYHPITCAKDLTGYFYDEEDIIQADFNYYKSPNNIKDVLYKDERNEGGDSLNCFNPTYPVSDSCSKSYISGK